MCWCRGLAGPDSSSSEGDSSDEEEAQEGAAAAGATGLGTTTDEESEAEEASDSGDDEAGPPQARRLLPGEPEEDEVPLTEADLQEWGVGALAANPEEQVGRADAWGVAPHAAAAPVHLQAGMAVGTVISAAWPLVLWMQLSARRRQRSPRLAPALFTVPRVAGVLPRLPTVKRPPSTSCAIPVPQVPLLPDATPRLAAVDLDWDHLRAVDVLAALRSFLPQGGAICSVVVYPSGGGGWGGGTEEARGLRLCVEWQLGGAKCADDPARAAMC
jgi:hypothetical protein